MDKCNRDDCRYYKVNSLDNCTKGGYAELTMQCIKNGYNNFEPILDDAVLADVRSILQEALEVIEDAQFIYGSGDRDEAVVENIKKFIGDHFS